MTLEQLARLEQIRKWLDLDSTSAVARLDAEDAKFLLDLYDRERYIAQRLLLALSGEGD